jgi:hypothetical protein
MTARPPHSRSSSYSNDQPHPHRPNNPSSLRQAITANRAGQPVDNLNRPATPPSPGPAFISRNETAPLLQDSSSGRRPSVHPAHAGYCTHGTFSPRPSSPTGQSFEGYRDEDGSLAAGEETPESGTTIAVLDNAISHIIGHEDWKKWLKRRMRTKKMGHSSQLAEQAGLQDTNLMWVPASIIKDQLMLTSSGTSPTIFRALPGCPSIRFPTSKATSLPR